MMDYGAGHRVVAFAAFDWALEAGLGDQVAGDKAGLAARARGMLAPGLADRRLCLAQRFAGVGVESAHGAGAQSFGGCPGIATSPSTAAATWNR